MKKDDSLQPKYYRYFIELAYDGTSYCGWQNQPNGVSVQQTIEKTLQIIFRRHLPIVGCGRTDAGVHASQFFAHFDINEAVENILSCEKLVHKLNSMLPKSIVVYRVFLVENELHARFSAIKRSYKYFISLDKNPFVNQYSTRIFTPVDLQRMNEAAKYLIGYQNFQCFSKVKTGVNNYFCTISHASWKQEGNMLVFDITANRFLRNMVRAIVGTLLAIGDGRWQVEDMSKILKGSDRCLAGKSVSAKGLFLTEVEYEINISRN